MIFFFVTFFAMLSEQQMVMPWMCLERCFNTTAHQIDLQILDLANHTDVVTDVAFELFNLGPNSTLVTNNLSPVADRLNALGFGTYAMISSYPYPPNFIDWLHDVWSNPQPFIKQCIVAAKKYKLTGFNIDFEPAGKTPMQKFVARCCFCYCCYFYGVKSEQLALSRATLCFTRRFSISSRAPCIKTTSKSA
jgi:hypothetical protein